MKLFQETYKGILAGLLVVAFAMAVNACQDKTPARTPEVAIPDAAVVAPLPSPPAAVLPGVTTAASTAVTPSAKPAPVKRASKAGVSKAETSAYAVAYRNAATANTLLGRHAFRTGPSDKVATS